MRNTHSAFTAHPNGLHRHHMRVTHATRSSAPRHGHTLCTRRDQLQRRMHTLPASNAPPHSTVPVLECQEFIAAVRDSHAGALSYAQMRRTSAHTPRGHWPRRRANAISPASTTSPQCTLPAVRKRAFRYYCDEQTTPSAPSVRAQPGRIAPAVHRGCDCAPPEHLVHR